LAVDLAEASVVEVVEAEALVDLAEEVLEVAEQVVNGKNKLNVKANRYIKRSII
jgi:hypothetical protein